MKIFLLSAAIDLQPYGRYNKSMVLHFIFADAIGRTEIIMIEFDYKLPSLNINGRQNGTYNNEEMALPCVLTTETAKPGKFLRLLHDELCHERKLVFIDGKVLMCNKNWIRDHVHIMKGFKHFDYDLKSYLEFTLQTQHEKGYFYELIKQMDDYHWTFVDDSHYVLYPDDNLSLVRLELEADVEYIMVEGVMQYYRATGDLDFVRKYIGNLEKGMDYITSDEKRFSKEYGLCIRPYTIDTWDFVDAIPSNTDRRIHEGEQMCMMHGDNSGAFRAMLDLAFFREKLGNNEKAEQWKRRAEEIRKNMFRYLWNGKFFVHQRPVTGEPLDENENIRLSLSEAYDINRGLTTLEEAGSIIDEYLKRRETTAAFAEWFSIDPPYEKFNIYNKGKYVNGAISPFTAGELAKAAFNNGYEAYGLDILERFMEMAERDGAVYFLYNPITGARQGGGPSAWGAAALLSAFDEGLAGVNDADCLYREINFEPKFAVCSYGEIRYLTGYEISHKFVDVRYVLKDEGMRYDIISEAEKINAKILLPKDKHCKALLVNGEEIPFAVETVRASEYVCASVSAAKKVSFEILFA